MINNMDPNNVSYYKNKIITTIVKMIIIDED